MTTEKPSIVKAVTKQQQVETYWWALSTGVRAQQGSAPRPPCLGIQCLEFQIVYQEAAER